MEVSLLFYTHAVAFYIPFTTSAPLRISRNSVYVVDSGQVCCGGVGGEAVCWGRIEQVYLGAWEKVQLCMQYGGCGCLRYMLGGGGAGVISAGL